MIASVDIEFSQEIQTQVYTGVQFTYRSLAMPGNRV